MSHARPVTSTPILSVPPPPTPKNGNPLGNLNPHNHFYIPEDRAALALPRVVVESEDQEFNLVFFEEAQIYQQYMILSAQKRISEVVNLFEGLIRIKPEKYKILLDYLVQIWLKISPEVSLSTLGLLEKLSFTEPLLSHVILILRGAIRITEGMHSTGIILIMHGLSQNSSSRTLEKYLWPVLKQLRSDEKLLKALEKPEEAILPLPIYFFKGVLALLDQNVQEAKRWLDRSVSDDFSQEKVDEILGSARKKRPPLQEIATRASKVPDTAKPRGSTSQLPPPKINTQRVQPILPTQTPPTAPCMRVPLPPPRVYYPPIQQLPPPPQNPPAAPSFGAPPQPSRVSTLQAQQLPPPPQTPPAVMRIPGDTFLVPFFETLENFTANKSLHQQNKVQLQVELYSQLIQKNPQKYLLLVNALIDLFPFNGAIPDIETIDMLTRINPDDQIPDILGGAYKIRNGEHQRGIELFKRGYSKKPAPALLQLILKLMQKWLAKNPPIYFQQQMPQHDLSLFKGIIELGRNQHSIANNHFEQGLNDPSSKPLAQAFRQHMGIPEQSQPLASRSPPSPNTQMAAEALSLISQAPANPSALN